MTTRYLFRQGGLGDVAMALAACKALKARSRETLVLVTGERLAPLARACPHVDEVWCQEALSPALRGVLSAADRIGLYHDLNPVGYGLAREHQIDAYLWAMGFEAAGESKSIDIDLPARNVRRVDALLARHGLGDGFVAIHPADGDPNRTWPAGHWLGLARMLREAGHRVVSIGAHGPKGAVAPDDASMVSLVGQLDVLDTIGLLRRATALVTTDGGPLHLAGASDTALVGLFSVVGGANRLPYRHGQAGWNAVALEPACPHFPCYRTLARPDVLKPLCTRIERGEYGLNDLFANWCLHEQPFACMNAGHQPRDVMRALALLGVAAPVRPAAPAQAAPAMSAIEVNASA